MPIKYRTPTVTSIGGRDGSVRSAPGKKVAIGKSTVEARVGLGPSDNGPGFTLAVELHVTLPGADAESAKDVVRGAHMVCPYSNATRNNIDVNLSLTPGDGNNYDVPISDRAVP